MLTQPSRAAYQWLFDLRSTVSPTAIAELKNCHTVVKRSRLVGPSLILSYTSIGAYLQIFRPSQSHNHPVEITYAARISNRAD